MRNGPALAALLLLAAGGCGRCGHRGAVPPERFFPADAPLALVVPRLRPALEQASALARTLVTFPAASGLAEAMAAVKGQLGFDPLDPEALARAGLDPERGLGAARAADGGLVLVLPARDGARLEETVAQLARDRLGAGRRAVVRAQGVEVTSFQVDGQPAALSLLLTRGSALLAAGPGGPTRLAALAGLAETASLQRSAPFERARAALGKEPVALLFAPPASPALARLGWLREGAAAGLWASSTRLAAAVAVLLGPERREAWRPALAAPAAPAEPPPLPGDAFLVARLAGDAAPLLRRALAAAPAAQAALARAHLDPERDLLAPLAPGASAALSLAPTFEVAAVSREGGGLVARDPFRLAHLTAALAVEGGPQAQAALEKLARAAPSLGLAAAPLHAAGRLGWRFSRGPLALEVAVDGRRLLVAGGAGRLATLLTGSGAGYAAPSADARAALAAGATGAVLDLGQLVASFRALPASAYGSGPDAFVMRSLAERVIDPAARLVAASARVTLTEEAARLELVVEARPPEAAR